MNKIIIYSIENCPYCDELKKLLINENIEFIDINVLLDENKAEYDKISKKTKTDVVPIIKVGKQLLVPNISFDTIQEGFDLTKKFLI